MQSRWWWIANKRVAAPRPALLEKSRKKKRKAIGQGRQFRRKKKKRKRKRRILPLQSSAVWPLPLQACCLFPCFSPPYFFCLPLNVQPPFFQATRFFCPSNAYFFFRRFSHFFESMPRLASARLFATFWAIGGSAFLPTGCAGPWGCRCTESRRFGVVFVRGHCW